MKIWVNADLWSSVHEQHSWLCGDLYSYIHARYHLGIFSWCTGRGNCLCCDGPHCLFSYHFSSLDILPCIPLVPIIIAFGFCSQRCTQLCLVAFLGARPGDITNCGCYEFHIWESQLRSVAYKPSVLPPNGLVFYNGCGLLCSPP